MIPQPTSTVPDWTSEDAKFLRDFLDSATGRKAMVFVTDQRPALMDGDNVNKTLVRNGEVKGFDAAVTFLISLTYEKPADQIPSGNYPPLDDEKAWSKEDPTTPNTP